MIDGAAEIIPSPHALFKDARFAKSDAAYPNDCLMITRSYVHLKYDGNLLCL